MAKVYQQKARKDYPEAGIKKGDTYFWTMVNGEEVKSLEDPRVGPAPESSKTSPIKGRRHRLEKLRDGVMKVFCKDGYEFGDSYLGELTREGRFWRPGPDGALRDCVPGVRDTYKSLEEFAQHLEELRPPLEPEKPKKRRSRAKAKQGELAL